jgi:hypothetical protein
MILDRLAGLGQAIKNAGVMPVNDLDAIKDLELYGRLLNEFPRWLVAARERGNR